MLVEIHEAITRRAMKGLAEACIDKAVECNRNQDSLIAMLGAYPEEHFDDSSFQDGINHVNRQWEQIRQQSRRGCNREALTEILCAFGRILHAIQDFYSHSNWVETHNDLWDGQTIPEGLVSGTYFLGKNPEGKPGPTHGDLNKDHPGRPYHTKAVRFALKHSRLLFERLKTEVPWLEECCKTMAQ
jgi:hypothetical protein